MSWPRHEMLKGSLDRQRTDAMVRKGAVASEPDLVYISVSETP
jgi:hypothetical protein